MLMTGLLRWPAQCSAGLYAQDVTINMPVAAFTKYRFQSSWVQVRPSFFLPNRLPCLLGVGPNGQTFELPSKFNELVRLENLSVSSPKEGSDIAVTYVILTAPIGRVMVLSDLVGVPGLDQHPPDPSLRAVISAPSVKRVEPNMYIVNLFVWKEFGGTVEKWTVTVFNDATVKSTNKLLATHVGNMIGLR